MSPRLEDQDFDIKLRMMRLLWHTGHFVRHNVSLERMSQAEHRSQAYTDIDVLALRFDPELTSSVLVADCKSGASAKTFERLFWIAGVMQLSGARRGFFVRAQMTTSRYSDLANQLNITPISLDQLRELEQAYHVVDAPFLGPYNKGMIEKASGAFRALHEVHAPVRNYILVKYWQDPVYQRIPTLMRALELISNEQKLDVTIRYFLSAYAVSMLGIALVQFSQPLLTIGQKDREEQITDRLFGGREESVKRKQLMESFYDFMAEEIQKRYHQRYPISKKEFLSHFHPDYTKYLVDLVERICRSPSQFVVVPQLLDLIAFEGILGSKALDDAKVTPIAHGMPLADLRKAAKDVITFVERSHVVDSAFATRLRELISPKEPEPSLDNGKTPRPPGPYAVDSNQMVLPEGGPR